MLNGKMFWKDDEHNADYHEVLDKLDCNMGDVYSVSFAYLISATGKAKYLLSHVSSMSVKAYKIQKDIEPYSKTERNMINFALQLFNSQMSDIKLDDVFAGLDSDNKRCVLEAIHLRYG